ncbi:MAG: DUF2130 domain-containing protein [Flavobacteriales bacterium]|nr:DUF2130 domain-containing protein [Flavobacteriales bacterium]
MMSESKINCPNCGTSIDVQDILSHQLESDIKQKYQSELAKEKKNFELQFKELSLAKDEFEKRKKQENELFQERLEKQLREDRRLMEDKIKIKMAEEQRDQFNLLQKELNEKSEQVKELNRTKADIERLKREKNELQEKAEADAQKRMNDLLITEKEKIKKAVEDGNELRIKELIKQLEDQKKLTEEMKRKQEQGSMQMQGEVLELAIEEFLQQQFPLDTIDEIKKGARGADCMQIVNTRTKTNCGKIYYESKRTKDFQPTWIEKFKADMREKNADIGVLVTETLPKDVDRLTNIDGIWICTFEEFKSLALVLRESIIRVSSALVIQENKGDKMGMLYDFLTSNEFKLQIEGIVEGFSVMKNDLDTEKRSMARIWKSREKQLEKVLLNTVNMYGSIKGIAGSAIANIDALELGGNIEDDDQALLE